MLLMNHNGIAKLNASSGSRQVRDPLGYINSRSGHGSPIKILRSCNMVTPPDSKGLAVMALHKWVHQNTFVAAQSDFMFKIEDVQEHPHALIVEICRKCALLHRQRNTAGAAAAAAGFADKKAGAPTCPSFSETMAVVAGMDAHENHNHTKHSKYTWEQLYALDKDMATAAALLAREYGYPDSPTFEPTDGMVIRCGFADQGPDEVWRKKHSRLAMESGTGGPSKWMCRLDRRGGIAQMPPLHRSVAAAAAPTPGSGVFNTTYRPEEAVPFHIMPPALFKGYQLCDISHTHIKHGHIAFALPLLAQHPWHTTAALAQVIFVPALLDFIGRNDCPKGVDYIKTIVEDIEGFGQYPAKRHVVIANDWKSKVLLKRYGAC